MTLDEQRKAIQGALVQMDKQFGKGSVLLLGSKNPLPVTVISSGSLAIDAALGVGGFPRGRVVEIYGPESSGKTTLTLHLIAEAQKAGGCAAFIDAEHALDPKYARKLGVDVDNLIVSQPDHGEQALEIAGALISTGAVSSGDNRFGSRPCSEGGARRRYGRQSHGTSGAIDVTGAP